MARHADGTGAGRRGKAKREALTAADPQRRDLMSNGASWRRLTVAALAELANRIHLTGRRLRRCRWSIALGLHKAVSALASRHRCGERSRTHDCEGALETASAYTPSTGALCTFWHSRWHFGFPAARSLEADLRIVSECRLGRDTQSLQPKANVAQPPTLLGCREAVAGPIAKFTGPVTTTLRCRCSGTRLAWMAQGTEEDVHTLAEMASDKVVGVDGGGE